MTHQEMIDEIAKYCEKHGCLLSYFPDSRQHKGDPGVPDLLIVGSHRFIFREVKVGGDRLSSHQVVWRYALFGAGADVEVWREDDLHHGQIEAEIEELNMAYTGSV